MCGQNVESLILNVVEYKVITGLSSVNDVPVGLHSILSSEMLQFLECLSPLELQ
jgi:hypothetical protein